MKIIAETHCHSIASDHAYSTILENVFYAKKKGLAALAITDHAPGGVEDAPHPWFFGNLTTIPNIIDGLVVLRGVEANVMDYDGTLDCEKWLLESLDLVIASFHGAPENDPPTIEKVTRAWVNIAKNPDVDIIGHCGTEWLKFDYETGIRAFKEYGKVVEINNHSFVIREGAAKNCREIALLCKKYGVDIVISSDAHFALDIAESPLAIKMLEEIGFPEEHILNIDKMRFFDYIEKRTGKRFDVE